MKKNYIFLLLFLIMAGCSKNLEQPVTQENGGIFNWSVQAEQQAYETRTSLNDNVLSWVAGDHIGVYANGLQENRMFTNTSGNTFSGGFITSGETKESIDYYAYYPYSAKVSDSNSKVVEATLPDVQSAPFDGSANFMVANVKSAAYNEESMPSMSFQFENQLMAIVKVSIANTSEDIQEQKLIGVSLEAGESEVLAGAFTFDVSQGNSAVATFSETASEVTNKVEIRYEEASAPTLGVGNTHDFYLLVKSGTVSKLKMLVKTTDYVYVINSSTATDFVKGEITILPSVDLKNFSVKKQSRKRTVLVWGDSITNLKYRAALQSLLGEDWNVVRGGISGDTPLGIAGRQGGIPLCLNTAFTIPASNESSVSISRLYSTRTVANVSGLTAVGGESYYTDAGGLLNPCLICFTDGGNEVEIEGNIKISGSDYTFQRSTSGEAIDVPAGAIVKTYGARTYKDADVNVIYMGANRGFNDDYQSLIGMHNAMLEYASSDKYVVLGFHMGFIQWSSSSYTYWTETYKDAMQTAFENHFVDMRTVVNADPLYYLHAAGVYSINETTLRAADQTSVSNGDWPACILRGYGTDVHPNDDGNKVMAQLVYDKMNTLGYLEY